MNNLNTEWTQSRFVDQPEYSHWSDHHKRKAEQDERCRVKDHVLGNHICTAIDPLHAKWIAGRLNLAAKLEQMTYDFATGKTDGSEITEMVHSAID
jgi:hypothetical protein